jgi:hypothetical protein
MMRIAVLVLSGLFVSLISLSDADCGYRNVQPPNHVPLFNRVSGAGVKSPAQASAAN